MEICTHYNDFYSKIMILDKDYEEIAKNLLFFVT
jgi:hypothetical protein